jgi:4-amino-4-deoxy-L-arabinose transferase-like glycosyltransferase
LHLLEKVCLAALPLVAFALMARGFRRRFDSLRVALLAASIAWGTSLVVLTECLSQFHLLTRTAVALAWAGVSIVAVLLPRLARRPGEQRLRPPTFADSWREWAWLDRALLLATAVILLLVGLDALLSPPNGWDQVEYHLPRIVEWAQRGSIAIFPAHYYNQLYPAPFAEWAMLHFYLLWGGDRLVNLVQWFAYAGCAVGASLIARQLGAALRGQLLAALASVTVPVAILEASGAKNDLVVSYWLIATISLLLHWRKAATWGNVVFAGLALGLAVLTKGTSYLMAPPLLVACLFLMPRHLRWRYMARMPLVALLVLALNAPHWMRNYQFSGSPLGLPAPDAAGRNKYAVDHYRLGSMAANVVKKTALHFGMPGEKLNAAATSVFRGAVRLLGEDPDDPETRTPTSRFRMLAWNRNEYWVGNPLHMLLIVALGVMAVAARRRMPPGAGVFAAGLAAAYLIFSVMTRWTLDGARLQMPFFMLGAALIGAVVARRLPRLVLPLAALLLVVALPFVLFNEERPLVAKSWFGLHGPGAGDNVFTSDRNRLLFFGHTKEIPSATDAALAARAYGCNDIGLDTTEQDLVYGGLDYQVMTLVQSTGGRVRYFGVHNLSTAYATAADRRTPCALICLRCAGNAAKQAAYNPDLPEALVYGDNLVFRRPSAAAGASQQN